MKKSFFVLGLMIGLVPVQSFSAVTPLNSNSSTLSDVVTFILGYFDQAILIILGLCVLFFVYGVYNYFFVKNESGEGRAEGGQFVLYAVIGFFVILSFWGLVSILKNTFGFGGVVPSASNVRNSIQLNGGTGGNSTFPADVRTGGFIDPTSNVD